MKETFYGMQCIIAPSIKRQVKTSKCKLLNWIYKKVYGFVEESVQEQDIIHLPFTNQLVFKDKATFNRVKEYMLSEVADSE
jgi:hypothetical protein